MTKSIQTRRKFLGNTAAAAAISVVPFNIISCSSGSSSRKPNSKVNGVQLGLTTYSYRSVPHSIDEVLDYVLQLTRWR